MDSTKNLNTAPTVMKETKNKIRVDFERTDLKTRLKAKFVSAAFVGKIIFYIFRLVLLIGLAYIILYPFITKIAGSIMSKTDFADITVRLIPRNPTLDTYKALLAETDTINGKMTEILDDATDQWGIKVNRVELKNIIPPAEIQNAMEKQMKAERDRRATILEAEGMKTAAILKAEGEKEAAINMAEGEKQAAILKADGIAQARILEAEGEKEAIRKIIDALQGNGQPDKYLIAMKYLESLESISEGQNNKVVYMPYEATGILSSIDGIKQMLSDK